MERFSNIDMWSRNVVFRLVTLQDIHSEQQSHSFKKEI